MTNESPIKFVTMIGGINEFDPEKEDWEDWIDRYDMLAKANKWGEESRWSEMRERMLLVLVGGKAFSIIKSLFPYGCSEASVPPDLREKCAMHFKKPTNELLARVQFYKLDQRWGQTLDEYEGELRRRAIPCNFGESLPVMLRDRFVAGLIDLEFQQYLLKHHEMNATAENSTGLTLEMALELGIHKKSQSSTSPCGCWKCEKNESKN